MRLVCTFGNGESCNDVAVRIQTTYKLLNNTIYVFQDANNITQYYYTYNIEDSGNVEFDFYTMPIHRYGPTNTLYTINALNMLIRSMNNNVLDKSIKINWTLYPNSLLLAIDNKVQIIHLALYKKIVE